MRSGLYRSTATTAAGLIRMPSSFSSAVTIVPSSIQIAFDKLAGTRLAGTQVSRNNDGSTLADRVVPCCLIYQLPDFQADLRGGYD